MKKVLSEVQSKRYRQLHKTHSMGEDGPITSAFKNLTYRSSAVMPFLQIDWACLKNSGHAFLSRLISSISPTYEVRNKAWFMAKFRLKGQLFFVPDKRHRNIFVLVYCKLLHSVFQWIPSQFPYQSETVVRSDAPNYVISRFHGDLDPVIALSVLGLSCPWIYKYLLRWGRNYGRLD